MASGLAPCQAAPRRACTCLPSRARHGARLLCAAQPKKDKKQARPQAKQAVKKQRPGSFLRLGRRKPVPVETEPKWGFFDAEAYTQAPSWDVPWGWPTIVLGTSAWAVSFLLTGILALPIAYYGFGVVDLSKMSALQESQLQLADQARPLHAWIVRMMYREWPVYACGKDARTDMCQSVARHSAPDRRAGTLLRWLHACTPSGACRYSRRASRSR